MSDDHSGENGGGYYDIPLNFEVDDINGGNFVGVGSNTYLNVEEINLSDRDLNTNMVIHVPEEMNVGKELHGDCSKSLVGVKMRTWEELFELYKEHSRDQGFSVKKSTTRTSDEGIVTEKYFRCSCEGATHSDSATITHVESEVGDGKMRKRRRVPHTRTGCHAFMRVKLGSDGNFEVVNHVVAHNHLLTRKEWQHHHRSERNIPPEEGELIDVMNEARVPPSVQYRLLVESCGGEDSVGHSKKDHYNYVTRKKMKVIEAGDAQNVIDMLHKRAAEDAGFFFRIKLDDEGRLCNVFWRDSMMKEDYLLYRDVMIFDTTYRTNKYNLICGAFVGINNHWSNVMFGCAFLSNEKTESFEWLFNVFNESMEGAAHPTSIFTDQDQAMTNAIEKVFPNTRQRLCQWHIHQNAISHFGSLKHDTSFNNTFNKCLRGCFNEEEFEVCWNKMVTDYGLENDDWFERLYGLRNKWCTTLSKDFFFAGILSSQRSESTNNAIGFEATKSTSLTDFYGIYGHTVQRWRSVEVKHEFDCSKSTPSSFLPMVGLLKHAGQVYTLTLFRDFEKEFGYAMGLRATVVGNEDNTIMYDVCPEDDLGAIQRVTFDCVNLFISCSSMNFEEAGWLCFHCIRVLHIHSVTQIPERYITKRWTKYAKTEVWNRVNENGNDNGQGKDNISWRRVMLRNFCNLIMKCQDVKEARILLEEGYKRDASEIDALFERLANLQLDTSNSASTSDRVLDPVRSVTKGRSQRKKRQLKNKKNGQPSSSVVGKDHCTYTPIPRLF